MLQHNEAHCSISLMLENNITLEKILHICVENPLLLKKLANREYCEANFGLENVLKESGSVSEDELLKAIEALSEDKQETLKWWLTVASGVPQLSVRIFVGYGWEKNVSARSDRFWNALRNKLNTIVSSFNGSSPDKFVSVGVNRLRASHAEFIFSGVERRIEDADILVFDVADTQSEVTGEKNEKCYTRFNANVLFEIGLAIGKGKQPFLLCPKSLKDAIPSDLSNYLWSFYTHKENSDGSLTLCFEDAVGFANCLRGLVSTRIREKMNS